MLVCLPLAAPIGLSPVDILTLCGSERVLVVPTEPLDDSSYSGVGSGSAVPGLLPVPLTRCIQSMLGLPTPALSCARWCVHLQDNFPDRGF